MTTLSERSERTSLNTKLNKLLLIRLVRERPAVWDKTNDSYRNELLKKAAWHEICRIMKKDYDKLNGTEQEKYYRWVIKVWRRTRDNWSKSLNASKTANNSGIILRPYNKYDTEMAFLKKVIGATKKIATEKDDMDAEEEKAQNEGNNEESGSNSVSFRHNEFNDAISAFLKKVIGATEKIATEEDDMGAKEEAQNEGNNEESGSNSVSFRHTVNEFNDDDTDDNWTVDSEEGIVTTMSHDHTLNKIDNTGKNNNITEDLIDAKITAYLSQMQTIKKINNILEDRHFAFFKSLHPSLISLDDDQTLEFQSSLINLLRNIKRGGRLNNVASNQPRSNSSEGYFIQPEARVLSHQLLKAPNEVQNISSGSAPTKRTQLKVAPDPLRTDRELCIEQVLNKFKN